MLKQDESDSDIKAIINFFDHRERGIVSDVDKMRDTEMAWARFLAPLTDEVRDFALSKIEEYGRSDLVERLESVKKPVRSEKISYANDYMLSELIGFVDRRASGETDGTERHITIEMAWDRFLTGSSRLGVGNILVKLQKVGRNDIFERFSHLMKIEDFDLDVIARREIENTGPKFGR